MFIVHHNETPQPSRLRTPVKCRQDLRYRFPRNLPSRQVQNRKEPRFLVLTVH